MTNSVSFVCTKCARLVSAGQDFELVSKPDAKKLQYNHIGDCPAELAKKWNGHEEGPAAAIRRMTKEKYGAD